MQIHPAVSQQLDILIVEDNPSDAALTLRALKKKNFEDIIVVKDGQEALDFIHGREPFTQRKPPRMILLDLKLPKVDGFAVLREVRQHPQFSSIPVVVFTSSNEERDVVMGYHLGANSYVVKPINFEKYINTIMQTIMYWMLTNRVSEQGNNSPS